MRTSDKKLTTSRGADGLLIILCAVALLLPSPSLLAQDTANVAERKAKVKSYLRGAFIAGMINAPELVEIKKALDAQTGPSEELLEMLETLADVQQRATEQFLAWWTSEREKFGFAERPAPRSSAAPAQERGASAPPTVSIKAAAQQPAGRWTGPTAFEFANKGSETVPEASLSNVVFIHGIRTERSLVPVQWEVKYDVGRSVGVKFLRQNALGRTDDLAADIGDTLGGIFNLKARPPAMPVDKLKTDSDQALRIALESLPSTVTVTSTEIKLVDHRRPRWEFRVWASKHSNTMQEQDLGLIWILAEDGSVIRNEAITNLNRLR